jgi:hypothetical protein
MPKNLELKFGQNLTRVEHRFEAGMRFKLTDIVNCEESFQDAFKILYDLKAKFKIGEIYSPTNDMVTVDYYILNNKSTSCYFKHIPKFQFSPGNYNLKKKSQENIKLIYNDNVIFHIQEVRYDIFKTIKEILTSLDIFKVFKYHYIGTPSNTMGCCFANTLIELKLFEHIKYNLNYLTSLYMLATRSSNFIYIVR